jgi:hypothetical protein
MNKNRSFNPLKTLGLPDSLGVARAVVKKEIKL